MKYKYLVILLIVTVSCNSGSKNERLNNQIDLNKTEAIEVHDELMVDLGKLHELKKQLEKNDEDSIPLERSNAIKIAIKKIEIADKSMWDWMHNFDVSFQHQNDSITLKYYNDKLSGIKKVKELFDSAIWSGNKLID